MARSIVAPPLLLSDQTRGFDVNKKVTSPPPTPPRGGGGGGTGVSSEITGKWEKRTAAAESVSVTSPERCRELRKREDARALLQETSAGSNTNKCKAAAVVAAVGSFLSSPHANIARKSGGGGGGLARKLRRRERGGREGAGGAEAR